MSDTARDLSSKGLGNLRERIISDPDMILDDRELMRALIAANETQMGANIVDLRGIAMERLERRLDRLEDTHRSVIAAAYENLAGTSQVQRAVLSLLDPTDFEGFLRALNREVAQSLRVDRVKLVLESGLVDAAGRARGDDAATALAEAFADSLVVRPSGWIEDYVTDGRSLPPRQVSLRQVADAPVAVYGDAAGWIQSEALLRLDLGEGRLPALLVLGAEDPHQFRPSQGTDLLAFFAGAFERIMRRWLS
ncbi:MAG: DUF484 family protein [Rhodobacteraceae bacterium]|nr:DUF484 family protein [Paracoccaceae bacterium]